MLNHLLQTVTDTVDSQFSDVKSEIMVNLKIHLRSIINFGYPAERSFINYIIIMVKIKNDYITLSYLRRKKVWPNLCHVLYCTMKYKI